MKKEIIAFFFILTVSIFSGCFEPVNGWTIEMPDVNATFGDIITVPVMAYNVTSTVPDIASANYNIEFNASVVNVTNVVTGNGNALLVSNWNFVANNVVRILAWDTSTGHTGDVNIADIIFKVHGDIGEISQINLSDSDFTDYTCKIIVPENIKNGSIVIMHPVEANKTIEFTDLSVGGEDIKIINWLWEFYYYNKTYIDSSTLQHPVYTFPSYGKYYVNLTVTNECGNRDSTGLICVDTGCPIPEARFAHTGLAC